MGWEDRQVEKIARTESLSDRVVKQLRDEIAAGRIPAGETVSAASIAERIGVSRTPVREALLRLEQAGMVRILNNRGALVLATTLEDLIEVFEMRLLLEPALAARAAELAAPAGVGEVRRAFEAMQASVGDTDRLLVLDRDFHLAIARAAGNERAVEVLGSLRNLVLTRGVGTTSTARTATELVEDHRGIVSGIASGDPQAAAREMRRHVLNTAKLLFAQESDGDDAYGPERIEARLAWTAVASER